MGSSLRRFSGFNTNMYTLIATLLAVASALPIEDTADVLAAKETFNAAFAAAEAGEHAALAPVNTDAQAAQITAEYLADAEEVAAAKAAFKAAFDDAAAGGLAAKQAPAPVAPAIAPLPLAAPAVAAGIPYGVSALNVLGGYPYAGLPAGGLPAGLPYAGLPAAGLPYAGLPYAGLPYAGLPVIAPAKTE